MTIDDSPFDRTNRELFERMDAGKVGLQGPFIGQSDMSAEVTREGEPLQMLNGDVLFQ